MEDYRIEEPKGNEKYECENCFKPIFFTKLIHEDKPFCSKSCVVEYAMMNELIKFEEIGRIFGRENKKEEFRKEFIELIQNYNLVDIIFDELLKKETEIEL